MLKDAIVALGQMFIMALMVWVFIFAIGEAHIYNNFSFMMCEIAACSITWFFLFVLRQWDTHKHHKKQVNRFVDYI